MKAQTIRLVGDSQRGYAKRVIDQAPPGYVVTVAAENRSQAQNRKLHPMLDDIRSQVEGMDAYTHDDIKLRFLNALGVEMRFLPALYGQGAFPVGLRSSLLTKEQFSGLLELLYAYGAENDIRWSDPKEPA